MNERPVRQSARRERHVEAGRELGDRFDGVTLVREDGTPTYHLASVVDDIDFGSRTSCRQRSSPDEEPHRRLFVALGATPPEFVHHRLILGEDGKKLARRAEGATVASLRDAGIPPEAVRRYLDSSACPGTTSTRPARIRRLAIEAVGTLSEHELAERVGAPLELVPALRVPAT